MELWATWKGDVKYHLRAKGRETLCGLTAPEKTSWRRELSPAACVCSACLQKQSIPRDFQNDAVTLGKQTDAEYIFCTDCGVKLKKARQVAHQSCCPKKQSSPKRPAPAVKPTSTKPSAKPVSNKPLFRELTEATRYWRPSYMTVPEAYKIVQKQGLDYLKHLHCEEIAEEEARKRGLQDRSNPYLTVPIKPRAKPKSAPSAPVQDRLVNKQKETNTEYVVCPDCSSEMKKHNLERHQSRCPKKQKNLAAERQRATIAQESEISTQICQDWGKVYERSHSGVDSHSTPSQPNRNHSKEWEAKSNLTYRRW